MTCCTIKGTWPLCLSLTPFFLTLFFDTFSSSNLRVVRFINNKTPCHYIVKSLLSCGKSNHEKSYAEDKPGKYLPKIATRCLSERYALARQISNYYSKSHFAECRLFNRTFHNCLVNPNKKKTQNETKNIIVGKSNKLGFTSENIVGNTKNKTDEKITNRHNEHVNYKSGKSFPKASVTKNCIFCFHRIKKFSSPKIKYGSSRCFSPGSFAVLSGAAPPPFRIFAGEFSGKMRSD